MDKMLEKLIEQEARLVKEQQSHLHRDNKVVAQN